MRNLREISIKYLSNHRTSRQMKKQCNIIFIGENLAVKVTMDCRTTSSKLRFKQYGVILAKGKSVLTKIMSLFEGENMKTQYNILDYRIELYFHEYKLAIGVDENGHSYRNIHYEIKR